MWIEIEPGLRPGQTEQGGRPYVGIVRLRCLSLEDRWILSRFNRVTGDVNEALQTYRFHEAANSIYDFFWGEFCDWYLELIKPRLQFERAPTIDAAQMACANLVNLFDASVAAAASGDAVHHGRDLAGDV